MGEQRLRIALEAARLGTWEYLVESEELITSLRYRQSVLIPRLFFVCRFRDAIVPEQRKVMQTALQALSASSDYKEQYEVKWPDEPHWVLAYGRPLTDERGNTRMVGVSLDDTNGEQFRVKPWACRPAQR